MSDLLQRLDDEDENEEFIQSFIHEINQLDTVSMEIDDYHYKIPETLKLSTDSTNNEFKSLKPLIDVNNEFNYQNKADYAPSNQSMASDLNNSLNDQVESPFKNQSDNYYRLFWIDAVEKSGLVYIVGKVNNQNYTK